MFHRTYNSSSEFESDLAKYKHGKVSIFTPIGILTGKLINLYKRDGEEKVHFSDSSDIFGDHNLLHSQAYDFGEILLDDECESLNCLFEHLEKNLEFKVVFNISEKNEIFYSENCYLEQIASKQIDLVIKDLKEEKVSNLNIKYLSKVQPQIFSNIAFIFGAGASADVLFTNEDLLYEIINDSERDTTKLEDLLRDYFNADLGFYNDYKYLPRINQIFNTIQIALDNNEALYNRFARRELEELRDELLSHMFIKFCERIDNSSKTSHYETIVKWIKDLINKKEVNVSLINLNYDLLLERSLVEDDIPIDYGIDIYDKRSNEILNNETCGISVINLHGSIDWMICKECNNIYKINNTYSGLITSPPLTCPEDNTELEWFVIPPQTEKYEGSNWSNLLEESFNILRNVDRVILIGYSLPVEDFKFQFKLKKALYRPENPVDIIAVGSDQEKMLNENGLKVYPKELDYWRFFGPLDYRPIGFEKFAQRPF